MAGEGVPSMHGAGHAMQQECALLSKGACEFVAVTIQDFVMRPLISEGIHCNSVVSINELDLHTAVGVIPAGKAAAHEVVPLEDHGPPEPLLACTHAGQDLCKHKAAQPSSNSRRQTG